MKKNCLLPSRAVARRSKAASSSWASQLSPTRPARGYLTVPLTDAQESSALLLCDPLTGLVAYPSFEAHMIEALPQLASDGVQLAIGDVDDLRGYVTAAKLNDAALFGHLAGNDCMRRVGEATRKWEAEVLDGWPFAVCATFGGDEVIVAAAGRPYDIFLDALTDLIVRIRAAAPRPCSFASATTRPVSRFATSAELAYRRLVSNVDASLFCHKAAVRNTGAKLSGALVDVGTVRLSRALMYHASQRNVR
jgi:GGDEF domain-containing protein